MVYFLFLTLTPKTKPIKTTFNRLANILAAKSNGEVWNIVKKVRSENWTLTSCPYGGLHSDPGSLVEIVENLLQVTSSDVIIENITTTKLEHAGEMFLYLVSCFEQLDPWYHFYADLLQNQPLDFVLLTLNRILKSDNPNQNEDLKTVAQKLFKRVGDLFSLKYPKIQNLTNGIGTLSWKNNSDWTGK